MTMETEGFIEEKVIFASGVNTLEGILAYPEVREVQEAVLLLSPHPHMGGRMDNNVIACLAQGLAGAGCATFRFNYAGVGGSTLDMQENDSSFEYWARLEREQNYRTVLPDALAAQTFLQSTAPRARQGYAGYSFGACLAILLAGVQPPDWIAAVAPPVSRAPLHGLEAVTMPSCFVAGDRDFAFDLVRFLPLYDQVAGPKRFIELPDCDHFFRKREADVLAAIWPMVGRDLAEDSV